MKKLLLIILGVLWSLPLFAQDFTYEYEGQTLTYTILDADAKTCEVKAGTTSKPGNDVSGELIIPEKAVNGDTEYTVTSIGNRAFYGCEALTSVTIGNTVEIIGDMAFYSCDNLTTLYFNAKNCTHCGSLNGNTAYNAFPENLKNIYIGDEVENIPDLAFISSSIETITIPNSVTSIGDYAFYGCSDLTSVTIGNSVETIGEQAFYNCSGLTKAEFASIESFCNINFCTLWSNPLYYANHLWINGEEVTELIIPNSTKKIGNYAFYRCESLTSATIGNSVTSIGENAFFHCTGLTEVTIPNSVETIGGYAFADCKSITSITIPEFVTSIGECAFGHCLELQSINVDENNKSYCSVDGVLFNKDMTTIIQVPAGKTGEYTIPGSVNTISERAFGGCFRLTSISIPESVTKIGDYAFQSCDGLTTIKLPNSLSTIPGAAFLSCNGLESVQIPSSVTSIEHGAFQRCISLKRVSIPGSVSSIGNSCFAWCPELTDVTFEDGVKPIQIESGNFVSPKVKNLKWGRPIESLNFPIDSLETLVIGNTIEEIPAGRFANLENLNSLSLGANIKTIADEAFMDCSKLTEVVLPPSLESVGVSAFEGNTNLADISMGSAVTSIGSRAFFDCPLEEIKITAQTPPAATDDSFSDYSATLWLQGDEAVEAYSNADTCWNKFNIKSMVEPTEIKTDGSTQIEGNAGDTFQLSVTLWPLDVTLNIIFWYSTNPDIATVDENGLVTLQADFNGGASINSATRNTHALADLGGECKIIAQSLYADAPVAEFTIRNNGTVSVDIISADKAGQAGQGKIDCSLPYSVYNISGQNVGNDINAVAPGMYIIHQNSTVTKVSVK